MIPAISLKLTERDVEHLRKVVQTAKSNLGKQSAVDIVNKAKHSIAELDTCDLPDFINEKLSSLKLLIASIEDEEWQTPVDEREEVLTALAYFIEPQDLVPDRTPIFGYLDDAIITELALQDMSLDLEAYSQFCHYRADEEEKHRDISWINRSSWIAHQREELRAELRRKKFKRVRERLFGNFL
ncbi:YkvA family protein [Aestuariibacter salexigens]|uniref:YkvA family protein n=1 Tax=Aestuariibacter salexigens TaxID=226010 RepID=UPI000417452C|nr:YkvA family protein [Aestuariibacter salexigens]